MGRVSSMGLRSNRRGRVWDVEKRRRRKRRKERGVLEVEEIRREEELVRRRKGEVGHFFQIKASDVFRGFWTITKV